MIDKYKYIIWFLLFAAILCISMEFIEIKTKLDHIQGIQHLHGVQLDRVEKGE
jgi:hypothetical protein